MVMNASKIQGGVGNEVGLCHNVIYRPPGALLTIISRNKKNDLDVVIHDPTDHNMMIKMVVVVVKCG